MKKTLQTVCAILVLIAVFTSCHKEKGISTITTSLQFSAPAELAGYNPVIGIQTLTLLNINTGETLNLVNPAVTKSAEASTAISVSVPEGLYTISMEGSLSYSINGETLHSKIRAYQESVTLTKDSAVEAVDMIGYLYNDSQNGGNFVIAEIFFTGTITPEEKQYTGDKYFRIYNNSGETLCADGLTIAESEFLTVSKYDYTPDIMNEAFTAQAIYRIPIGGNIMVAPGESLLLCDIGMDHRSANENSFDLTLADFEWYDESSNPNFLDTDTDVPNMEKIYCYTATIWGPHNRGFTSYVLARLGDDQANQLSAEQYLADYSYAYTYNFIFGGAAYEMSSEAYKIPNKWILDAVNLSVESEYVWNVVSPALDKGWTYCGKVDKDATRYGKSVRRKVLSGLTLQDTNNSSEDFLPEQTADPYFLFHE